MQTMKDMVMTRMMTYGFVSLRDEENKVFVNRFSMLVRKSTYALKYKDYKYVISAVTNVKYREWSKKMQ